MLIFLRKKTRKIVFDLNAPFNVLLYTHTHCPHQGIELSLLEQKDLLEKLVLTIYLHETVQEC